MRDEKHAKREIFSNDLGFENAISISLFVYKKTKWVILFSTIQSDKFVDGYKKKGEPQAILSYNTIIVNVDVMDQMLTKHTTKCYIEYDENTSIEIKRMQIFKSTLKTSIWNTY